jgi:hypothetical protein
MIKFSNFVNESTDNHGKLVQKLEKTLKTIQNHYRRGGESYHKVGGDLARRYTGFKNKLRETPEGEKHWKEYCAKHKFATDHSGHDHYA